MAEINRGVLYVMWIVLLNLSHLGQSPTFRTLSESYEDTAVEEFQLGVSAVGGEAQYLAHQMKKVSGLVETALDVQVYSPLTVNGAAKIGEPVRRQEIFILNLDWASLLVVFSAITSVFLLLMLRPTCFAKMLSRRIFSSI